MCQLGPREAGKAVWTANKTLQNAKSTFTSTKPDAILNTSDKIGVNADVNFVCNLDPNIYSVVTKNITTTKVVVTDKQLEHIKARHPDISDTVLKQLAQAVQQPDYILDTNMPTTANILKRLEIDGKGYQVILRIRTDSDPDTYQNSIITFMSVNEKRYKQYLRNRKILYKRE